MYVFTVCLPVITPRSCALVTSFETCEIRNQIKHRKHPLTSPFHERYLVSVVPCFMLSAYVGHWVLPLVSPWISTALTKLSFEKAHVSLAQLTSHGVVLGGVVLTAWNVQLGRVSTPVYHEWMNKWMNEWMNAQIKIQQTLVLTRNLEWKDPATIF